MTATPSDRKTRDLLTVLHRHPFLAENCLAHRLLLALNITRTLYAFVADHARFPTSQAFSRPGTTEHAAIEPEAEIAIMSRPEPEQFHQTSRAKAIAAGNEEASTTINLGEFQEVDTLTLSEAALVINALVSKRRNDRKNVNETEYACADSLLTSPSPSNVMPRAHWTCCSAFVGDSCCDPCG